MVQRSQSLLCWTMLQYTTEEELEVLQYQSQSLLCWTMLQYNAKIEFGQLTKVSQSLLCWTMLQYSIMLKSIHILMSLNPCCAGRCSSTRETETILIINMLQNYTEVIFAFLKQKLTISQRLQSYDFFLRYASQLFLNILPFYISKFNSVNNKHKS